MDFSEKMAELVKKLTKAHYEAIGAAATVLVDRKVDVLVSWGQHGMTPIDQFGTDKECVISCTELRRNSDNLLLTTIMMVERNYLIHTRTVWTDDGFRLAGIEETLGLGTKRSSTGPE